ncbi:hypothetical protein V8C35DRAFT_286699 [Trichoderma chlorosporum]
MAVAVSFFFLFFPFILFYLILSHLCCFVWLMSSSIAYFCCGVVASSLARQPGPAGS